MSENVEKRGPSGGLLVAMLGQRHRKFPNGVTSCYDRFGTTIARYRLLRLPLFDRIKVLRSTSIYFNSAAFSVPGQFAFGTSSQYNSRFRQPPILSDNISLVKQLYVWPTGDGSRMRLQFRADAFNAFNRTNFGVNGTVSNPNFGRATGPQQSNGRIITMGVRLYF